MSLKIIPIILAGGVGTRLWPMSRETHPKQFLRLFSKHSLLQETVLRVQSLIEIEQPVIVCNIDHYFLSHDHLKEINVNGYQFILEPFGKNTAPAIACAAQFTLKHIDADSILLVLPSDHYIADLNLFLEAVNRAKEVAQKGFLVTFGVVPTHSETGYGYIQAGNNLINNETYHVGKFIEKPPLELAKELVDAGNFYWNSGMFMFKPQNYLEELEKFSPEAHHFAVQSVLTGEKKDDYLRLNSEIFAHCPDNSIDYAVMEKTCRAALIPLASSWNDLGCWEAVAKSGNCDAQNNVIRGEVLLRDSAHCFVSSENQLVALLGINNQVIVTTPDVVLVADKAYSQDVKHLVQQLKLHNSHLVTHHRKQPHSAGYTENLMNEDYFAAEHFMLKPLSKYVLPTSPYPAQCVMLKGSVEILVNQEFLKLGPHESLLVDKQLVCHLRNNSDQPIHLMRIQLKFPLDAEISPKTDVEANLL
jgi:mannose-1-phosphate guanylyltransferase / mannose-6-phosphate isomerase